MTCKTESCCDASSVKTVFVSPENLELVTFSPNRRCELEHYVPAEPVPVNDPSKM